MKCFASPQKWLWLVLAGSPLIYAQAQTTEKKKWWHPESLAARNLNFIPLPTASISPETGLKFGLAVDYFYKISSKDSNTRTSFSWIAADYSTRKQLNLEAFTSTFTKGEKYFVGFRGGFLNTFERYWGTSEAGGNDHYATISYKRLYTSGKVSRNIGRRIFVGLNYYYSNYYQIKQDNSKVPASAQLPGLNSSEVSGVGIDLNLDRRDNQFSPSTGIFINISNNYYFDRSNGRYMYYGLNFDLRKYCHLQRHIIATQVLFFHLNGNVPVMEFHRLGGANIMRGFFQGRFRDKNLWALQTEYRYTLSKMLKIAAFASAGGTSSGFSEITNNQLHVAGGTGLRLLVNKSKKLYLRGDVAISSVGSVGYYFKIGDAF